MAVIVTMEVDIHPRGAMVDMDTDTERPMDMETITPVQILRQELAPESAMVSLLQLKI